MSKQPRRPLPPPPSSLPPPASLPPRKTTALPPEPLYEVDPLPVSRTFPPLPPQQSLEHDPGIYDDGDEAPSIAFNQEIYDEAFEAPVPVSRQLPPHPPLDQPLYEEGDIAPPPIPQGRKPLPLSPGLDQEEQEDFGPDENYDQFEIAPTHGHEQIATYDDEESGVNDELYSDPSEESEFSAPALPRHVTQINQLPASQCLPPPARRNLPIPPTPVHQAENYEEVPDFDTGEEYEDLNDLMDPEPRRFPPKPMRSPQERPARPLPSIDSAKDDNSGSSDSSGGQVPPQTKVKKNLPPGGFDPAQILKVKLKATNPLPKTNKKEETDEYNHISSARFRLKKPSESSNDVVPLKPPSNALSKSSAISPPSAIGPPKISKRPPKLPTADSSENNIPVPKVQVQVSPPVPVVSKPPVKLQDIPSAIVSPMRPVKIIPEEPSTVLSVSESDTQNNNNNDEEEDQLMVYPWFHGNITRKETEQRLLQVGGDGVYLVRKSRKGSADQPYTLTILYQNSFFTLKIRCREKDKKIALGEEKTGEMCFSSVASLISYHKDHNVILIGNPGGKTMLSSFPPSE